MSERKHSKLSSANEMVELFITKLVSIVKAVQKPAVADALGSHYNRFRQHHLCVGLSAG